ncbi:MAG: peptidylprolyl isomerase [Pseudomonadota bacterium]
MPHFVATAFAFLALIAGSVSAEETASDISYVRIQTSLGNIDVALNAKKAPLTVENFLAYAKSGYYDRLIFHRVVHGTLIQGGGLTKRLTRRASNDPIISESNNGLKNVRGTIAMARFDDPDSATSQFYINLKDNPSLDRTGEVYKKDAGYTVFGTVISGMPVADEIGNTPTGPASGEQFGGIALASDVPLDPVFILRIDPVAADDIQYDAQSPAPGDNATFQPTTVPEAPQKP